MATTAAPLESATRPVFDASSQAVAASFRDPCGFVYERDGRLLRQVNGSYQESYDLLLGSGLYEELTAASLLVAHQECDVGLAAMPGAYKVLEPERVDFISYPYEWSFGQLRDAALLTLDVQRRAMARGMSLRDASAYNVQFHRGRPVFIDTLSFERYREGTPWVAYRQFCQHFLAPLALMSCTDVRLGQLLRVHLDGIPLDSASRLLPLRTRLDGLAVHVHLHARSQRRCSDGTRAGRGGGAQAQLSRQGLDNIVADLNHTVSRLSFRCPQSEWADYYEANNNYGAPGLAAKEQQVARLLQKLGSPRDVWDLGANTGRFSRVAAAAGASVVAWDLDPACVHHHYEQGRKRGETRILPLVLDLTNPSPGLGWDHGERSSLAARGPVSSVLALGLIHHLAISNNLPLSRVAHTFSTLARSALVEFVPKEDSQVQKLLASREDVFPQYHRAGFEEAFAGYFHIEAREAIDGTQRTLYAMTSRLHPRATEPQGTD